MAEPTLAQVFGDNASQDLTTLTITKADLPITADAANNAEGLLVAIILKAKGYLSDATTNPDMQITIEEGFESLVTVDSVQYRQKQLTLSLLKPDPSSDISADDY